MSGPIPSIATRPGVARPVTFSAALREVLAWLGLVPVRRSLADRMAEQRRIDRLAEQLDSDALDSGPAKLDSPPALDSPRPLPARRRRGKA